MISKQSLPVFLLLLLLGLLCSFAGAGMAQNSQPVTTTPVPVYSGDKSSTITTTGSFQLVFPYVPSSIAPRRGCTIQNNGTGTMWVYVHQQAAGTAVKTSSYQIAPPGGGQGGRFNCVTGAGGVLQDQIDITGTAGDNFTATQQ